MDKLNELIAQDEHDPSRIYDAICRLMRHRFESLKICVAYVTGGGAALLAESGEHEMGGELWNQIDKQFVTSLDYGITSPSGLRALCSLPKSSVRIANVEAIGGSSLRPRSAFHPKGFCVHERQSGVIVVGSPNLTQTAFTTNTEIAIMSGITELVGAFLDSFRRLDGLVEADDALIDRYDEVRSRSARFKGFDDPPEEVPGPADPPSFAEFAAKSGQHFPSRFWIEAGSMSSSGSHHQLELPRYGHRFFGFQFDRHGKQQEDIGEVTLQRGANKWEGQRIVWHGDNGMERIYLPTLAQGGTSYVSSAILFQRSADTPNVFVFTVTPWGSPLARSWRNASIVTNVVFRIPLESRPNARICGLLP